MIPSSSSFLNYATYIHRLNEGFATYIEYKGVKSYETGWDMDSQFLTGDLHPVLELDATEASHPIVVDVSTPDEINAVFDTIAYSKGASVIRMMEDFMGEDDFRRGISNFLKKYSFQNAVTEDLLRELSAVSTEGLNVTHIMNTWTRQKGDLIVSSCVLHDAHKFTVLDLRNDKTLLTI